MSLEGFTRYQSERAEDWERQALVKARVCAGDRELGARVIAVARKAAYERGAPDPERLHHLRTRMQRELGHERLDRSPARYDMKVGRGGIVDVEFAAQWLQMRHGHDPRVRTHRDRGGALGARDLRPPRRRRWPRRCATGGASSGGSSSGSGSRTGRA